MSKNFQIERTNEGKINISCIVNKVWHADNGAINLCWIVSHKQAREIAAILIELANDERDRQFMEELEQIT